MVGSACEGSWPKRSQMVSGTVPAVGLSGEDARDLAVAAVAVGGFGLGVVNRRWPPSPKPSEASWAITRSRGDSFLLTNKGGLPARSVSLGGTGMVNGPTSWGVIEAEASVEFMRLLALAQEDKEITVRWNDSKGRSQRWSTDVP